MTEKELSILVINKIDSAATFEAMKAANQVNEDELYLIGGDGAGGVSGVKGSAEESYRTGQVSISKANIGLGNVDNTSDANKPISTTQKKALDGKVDKVAGKGLSTNDLTAALKSNYDAAYTHSTSTHAPSNAEKNIIVGIQKNGTDVSVNSSTRKVNIIVPTKTSDITNDSGFATETYVDTKVAGVVNSAPETLDTLNELAEALGNDPNFATTMATELGKKVDKVTGKGLSTNDYTTTEKNKLNEIEANANNYSLPVATSTALGGVKSGTDITVDASGNVSVNDDSHNHVISNVDGLQTALDGKVSTVTGKGLSSNDYTSGEKSKLAGIAAGANNYSLPKAGSSLGGVQSGGDVSIENGLISYKSTMPIAKGGTGATTAAQACTNLGALPLSGGTLTGNLTGKYLAGTWLQTTSVSEQSAAASKIATIDENGWIYYRTPANIVSDLKIFQTTGGTITGAVKLTSGTNYGPSLPTTIPAAGTIFFKKM